MSRTINDILSDVGGVLRPLIVEAFDLGRQAGRDEAARDLREKIEGVLSGQLPVERAPVIVTGPVTPPEGLLESLPIPAQRAAPGTVKPVIEALIRNTLFGMTTEEITARAGVKHNSVRGTLHTLKNEGKVERRGNRWFPVPQTNEAADNVSVRDPSAASEQEPSAQGGEARPGGGT